jgi:hypothetical protein
MKQALILLLLMAGNVCSSHAQKTEDSVKTVVNNLFIAMKTSDGALLKSCFSDSAILQTIGRNKEGKTMIRNEQLDEFISLVNKENKGALDERIVFDAIRFDGPLAMVWTPYSFYYNDKFSHCGVNSFQLVRTEDGWKIQYLIDTRRRTDCK